MDLDREQAGKCEKHGCGGQPWRVAWQVVGGTAQLQGELNNLVAWEVPGCLKLAGHLEAVQVHSEVSAVVPVVERGSDDLHTGMKGGGE